MVFFADTNVFKQNNVRSYFSSMWCLLSFIVAFLVGLTQILNLTVRFFSQTYVYGGVIKNILVKIICVTYMLI